MIVDIQEKAPLEYELDSAFLLYRHGNERVVTRHRIHGTKDAPRLGPGQFTTTSFVMRLLKTLSNAPLAYIPTNVVATTFGSVAWFEPAGLRPMYFKPNTDEAVRAFDGKMIPQPPLLFIGGDRSFSVYALEKNERPTLDTVLCAAPYWNVFNDHRICIGSMRVPKAISPTQTANWTNAFFASEFTHLSGGKRWAFEGTYAELLTAACNAGTFNTEWLQATKVKLEQAICGK